RAVHEVVPGIAVEQGVERAHDDQPLCAVGDERVVVQRVDLLLLVLGPDLPARVHGLRRGQRDRGRVLRLSVELLPESGYAPAPVCGRRPCISRGALQAFSTPSRAAWQSVQVRVSVARTVWGTWVENAPPEKPADDVVCCCE